MNLFTKSYIKFVHFFTIIVMFSQTLSAQNNSSQPSLPQLIEGVKYASLTIHSPEGNDSKVRKGITLTSEQYLRALGFEDVVSNSFQKNALYQKLNTYCDLVEIDFHYRHAYRKIDNIVIDFKFCDGTHIQKVIGQGVTLDGDLIGKLVSLWSNVSAYRRGYNPNNRCAIRKHILKYSENTLTLLLQDEEISLKPIEGIYQVINPLSHNLYSQLKIAIFREKTSNEYDIIYLEGAPNQSDWRQGEVMGYIGNTSRQNSFFAFSNINWYFLDKKASHKTHMVFTGQKKDKFTLSFSDNELMLNFQKISIPKMHPPTPKPPSDKEYVKDHPRSNCNQPSAFGSGIAISQEGHILTNYHVIRGADFVTVSINGGVEFQAEVVKEHIQNDIALLKIVDNNFPGFYTTIPYFFNESQMEIGQSIYTLGYPLYNKSKEIKLRKGHISATNGFGDNTTYETSLNIQPGNSGAPVINDKGEFIGLVRSKYSKSPGISFVIKSSVILEFMESLNFHIELPKSRNLNNAPLTDQVKRLKRFVLHIKSYKQCY